MSKPRLSAKQKEAIARQAGDCCEYCRSQAQYCPDPFSIEHVTPLTRSGTDAVENLALSCQGCNNWKYTHTGAYDPVTGKLVPLYHPRRQQWADHFVWSEDYAQMIGLTPGGRAMIDSLQLNREGVVNLRQVLRMIDRHPP